MRIGVPGFRVEGFGECEGSSEVCTIQNHGGHSMKGAC